MDPLDALTTNSQLYWNRVEESKHCFESDASLTEPVRIVDVPAAAKLQPNSPVRRKECTSLGAVEDYLGNPAHVYTSRLM